MPTMLRSADRSTGGDAGFAASDLLAVGHLSGTQLLVVALCQASRSAVLFRLVPRFGAPPASSEPVTS